ncbi:hypothetical protein ABLB84_14080 [Xenorhabdus szentirmaii]|uniref:hypothetical protein n=1 Tax=Xenorhabdus szentirmaii TaxID=290112 RepID=UPI0032B72EDC
MQVWVSKTRPKPQPERVQGSQVWRHEKSLLRQHKKKSTRTTGQPHDNKDNPND